MRKAGMALVVAALLASLAPGSASAYTPLTGERIIVGLAPETFPADTPFWIGNALGVPRSPGAISPNTYRIDLFVDGAKVQMILNVELMEPDWVNKFYLHNFRFGLSEGTHHFEQRYYSGGSLPDVYVADILFVQP